MNTGEYNALKTAHDEINGLRKRESQLDRKRLIEDAQAARACVSKGNYRFAILHLKWMLEKLLPEDQRYCTQTLPDSDPDKTVQGYLDEIVSILRSERQRRAVGYVAPLTESGKQIQI